MGLEIRELNHIVCNDCGETNIKSAKSRIYLLVNKIAIS
jgi:hypothetical protein